jgi:putative copper export protein/mono/diheme cytochrome c family protein
MTIPAIAMALLRGLHLAATLSLLGTAGFIAWVLPAAAGAPASLHWRLERLWQVSGLVALVAGAAWFVTQAAVIADAGNARDVLDALPLVAAHTRYGTMMMVRLGLLLMATLAGVRAARPFGLVLPRASAGATHEGPRAERRPHRGLVFLALVLTMLALGLQGCIGHAGATEGAIGEGLVVSEALHLIAAGFWLGALPPLWLSLRALPSEQAASVCERFSPIGIGCVLVLAGTGFAQGLQLIGSIPGLFGTPYGRIALLKIALFVLALILAGVNRLWLTDRLAAGVTDARRHLLASVALETYLGLAIVAAAGFLASSVPAEHSVPVWPFSWQLSLITVNEDPGFRREVILSALFIGGAILLMVAAMLWRRFRLAAFAILAVTAVLRAPSLNLLMVEAYPTSFQTSPTGFAAISIAHGEALFLRNCAGCHGPEGEGDGPAAVGLHIKPDDLTMPHVLQHTDGEMFWWLTHGVDDPEGGLAMPGFAASLSADDRWALIDYVRAHNIGTARTRDYEVPVQAPAFPVACDGVAAAISTDLRGHAVHVLLGEPPANPPPMPPQGGISTVTLIVPSDETANTRPPAGACVAADPAAWNAYAVLAGLPLDEVAGTEFLVDPNGWLRAVQRPGATDGWQSGNNLLAAIHRICTQPVEQSQGGQHDHHH